MTVPYRPPGYHSVKPYLALRDAKAAIDFYSRASGAALVLSSTCRTVPLPLPRSASATRS
jgi:hypothetical protein